MAELVKEFTGNPAYTFAPTEDVRTTTSERLEAAVRSALEDPLTIPAEPEVVIPLGRTWAFDFTERRFVRAAARR